MFSQYSSQLGFSDPDDYQRAKAVLMHANYTKEGLSGALGVTGVLTVHASDIPVWRWRTAFQNDFAARMTWSVADYAHANHNPIAVVNGQA